MRLSSVARLVERDHDIVIHAARQTGKATAVGAYADALRAQGIKRHPRGPTVATPSREDGGNAAGPAGPNDLPP